MTSRNFEGSAIRAAVLNELVSTDKCVPTLITAAVIMLTYMHSVEELVDIVHKD